VILENDPYLKQNQPAVTLVKPETWDQIKEIILKDNSVKEDIKKLEAGSDDW